MRKDSIDNSALEKAYLIYKEHGHQIVDYTHPPTDYKRKTVEEPEHTSKLRDSYSELLPPEARNREFNALATRDNQIQGELAELQQQMATSRQRGNFQMLQNQIKRMESLIKEKEAVDAKMAVANLGAAEMDVYNDTMKQKCHSYSEIDQISAQIAALEEKMKEYMGE
jgi:hypothetical protein